ncbi:MAG: GNAT family N-acetyltransferase [archaeon]
MRIRDACQKDVAALFSLLNSSEYLKANEDDSYGESYVRSRLDHPIIKMLVVEEDQGPVGLLVAEIWEDLKYCYNDILVIHPDHQGKGLGKALMDELERRCREKRLDNIFLLTNTKNDGMQRLVETKGYKKGYPFYIYEKKLT